MTGASGRCLGRSYPDQPAQLLEATFADPVDLPKLLDLFYALPEAERREIFNGWTPDAETPDRAELHDLVDKWPLHRCLVLESRRDGKVQTDFVKGTETAIHLPGLLSFASVSIRGKDVYRVRPEEGLGLCRHC